MPTSPIHFTSDLPPAACAFPPPPPPKNPFFILSSSPCPSANLLKLEAYDQSIGTQRSRENEREEQRRRMQRNRKKSSGGLLCGKRLGWSPRRKIPGVRSKISEKAHQSVCSCTHGVRQRTSVKKNLPSARWISWSGKGLLKSSKGNYLVPRHKADGRMRVGHMQNCDEDLIERKTGLGKH
eukprot:932785-Rhodomonas_salina.2